jgi:single-strand DNA-binding protein
MNKIILMGRLTRDPEIRYSQNDNPIPIARYSIAVDKRQKREDGVKSDFFHLVAFDRNATFAEKYLRKGIKIVVTGHVQTGWYEKNGVNMPFFEVVVEEQEFAESKRASQSSANNQNLADEGGFLQVPDDLEDLPFE